MYICVMQSVEISIYLNHEAKFILAFLIIV